MKKIVSKKKSIFSKVALLFFIAIAIERIRKYHAEEKRKEQPTVISGCLSHCAVVTITLRKNQLPSDVVKAVAKLQEIVKKVIKRKRRRFNCWRWL